MELEAGRKTDNVEGQENGAGMEFEAGRKTSNVERQTSNDPDSPPQTSNVKRQTSHVTRPTRDSQLSLGLEVDGKEGKRARRKTSNAKRQTSHSGLPPEFYQEVLDEAHNADFAAARGDDSLDDEIALLRVKIKIIWEDEPADHKLFLEAVDILAKLVKAKYSTHKKEDKSLGEAIQNIVRDIGVPLGVAALNKKL